MMNKAKQLKKWLFPACVLAVLLLGTITVWQVKPSPHFEIRDGGAEFQFSIGNNGVIESGGRAK